MIVKAGNCFGRLTTISIIGRSADNHNIWLCKCDCGTECSRQSNVLKASVTPSCGCAARDLHVIHGMRGSPEYNSWQSAKRRCHNPDDKDFHRYGARGIAMCDEWRNSFENFFASMGPRPDGTTIERKDTNGNYDPNNCVWATASEQARNRRSSVWINWRGVKTHLSDVAADIGITYGAAFMRLKRGNLHDNN